MRQPAVPQVWSEKAEVVGLPGVRYVVRVRYTVRSEMPEFTQDAIESFNREQACLATKGQGANLPSPNLPPINFLAISGGATMVRSLLDYCMARQRPVTGRSSKGSLALARVR
ncbi:hypothetical protein [Nitrosomonas communis]|uniref:hypothetical protein n=1 Tax=Nitrosomonas communis TaxID=44574 RepID=UPI003D2E1DE5